MFAKIVSEWMTGKELNTKRGGSTAITRNVEDNAEVTTDTGVKIADLAGEGSVVAVAADADSSYDYCLLKVISDTVVELSEDITDDYGSVYTTEQEVLNGTSSSEIILLIWPTDLRIVHTAIV